MRTKPSKRPYRKRYIVFRVDTYISDNLEGHVLGRREVIHMVNSALRRWRGDRCLDEDGLWIRIYDFNAPYGIAMVPHRCRDIAMAILNSIDHTVVYGKKLRVRVRTLKTTGTIKKARMRIEGYIERDRNRDKYAKNRTPPAIQ